jgi:hypothetical protein
VETGTVLNETFLGSFDFGEVTQTANSCTDRGKIWMVVVDGWVVSWIWRREGHET